MVLSGSTLLPVCLPQLIQELIAVQPDGKAVSFRNEHLTYRELNEAANRFANALLEAEVPPESLIGVLMDRSPALLAALLGIWKAGTAYLPLDPSYPRERIALLLEDSGAQFLIAEKKHALLLPAHSVKLLYSDQILLSDRLRDLRDPEIVSSGNSLAYVLYTSGSTGKPKGVEVCHGGLANTVTSIAHELQLQAGEVLLAHSSIGFDVSNLEMYLPLISGGSVYIAESDSAADGERLIRALHVSGATTLLGTPTFWRLLLNSGWEGKPDLRIISGGEVLSVELANALIPRSRAVWNQYGATETTICSTTTRIDPSTDRITIGRTIPNVAVYILDSNLQPVTPGTTGELHIGGAGVARGYRNRPDLTSASFLADPFSPQPGARLYKTGDLGRELPDGYLEFFGRVDNQVKIRGIRIEFEEIEECIRQYPGVHAAVLSAIEMGEDEKRLVAWIETKQTLSSALLKEFLKKRLPAYMIPSEFHYVDSLPVNQGGKVDRVALDANISGIRVNAELACEPENDVECKLKAIWEELLHVKSIPLTGSFFELGGNSLIAARLVAQIEKQFGHKMTVSALIQCPTIRSLAAYIMQERKSTGWRALVPLRAAGQRPPLFIVHGLGGNVLLFRSLSAHLGGDQPVYGLTLPSGLIEDRRETDITAVAAKYIDEIRSIFPSGPYHLSGHSFGGLLAFEMARQFVDTGQQVGVLALLDSDRNLARSIATPFANRGRPWLTLNYWKKKIETLMRQGVTETIRRRVTYLRLKHQVWLAAKTPQDETSKRKFAANELLVVAAANYNPLPYPGSAVLFRAEHEFKSADGDAMGWADAVRGPLEIVEIPGSHLGLFDESNAAILAADLRERMDRFADRSSVVEMPKRTQAADAAQ